MKHCERHGPKKDPYCVDCWKDARERTALGPSDATACSACGQKPRRKVDYGDFSEYEVRCLVADYCMSVTLGCTGWGVDFIKWVELRGIARHDGLFRLIRMPNPQDVEQPSGKGLDETPCSSFCHPAEKCCITKDGKCDVLREVARSVAGHIRKPYSAGEIAAIIGSGDYSAEMMMQHLLILVTNAEL